MAALVEDSNASYVTFFKKDGSELDWAIKTVMSGNGYLMDVSLSPDGTQVMLSDLYLQDGALKTGLYFQFLRIWKELSRPSGRRF